jgi:hypothetical protein
MSKGKTDETQALRQAAARADGATLSTQAPSAGPTATVSPASAAGTPSPSVTAWSCAGVQGDPSSVGRPGGTVVIQVGPVTVPQKVGLGMVAEKERRLAALQEQLRRLAEQTPQYAGQTPQHAGLVPLRQQLVEVEAKRAKVQAQLAAIQDAEARFVRGEAVADAALAGGAEAERQLGLLDKRLAEVRSKLTSEQVAFGQVAERIANDLVMQTAAAQAEAVGSFASSPSHATLIEAVILKWLAADSPRLHQEARDLVAQLGAPAVPQTPGRLIPNMFAPKEVALFNATPTPAEMAAMAQKAKMIAAGSLPSPPPPAPGADPLTPPAEFLAAKAAERLAQEQAQEQGEKKP